MRLRHIATANAAFFSGSQILFVPLFPWLAERMQAPLAHVLACFSAGSFLFLWGAPFWARRSDRDGRIPVLLIGSTGLALAFSLTAFLGLGLVHGHAALALLLFARIVYGLFAAATAPVAQAQQSDLEPPSRQGHAMGRHSLALAGGRVLALGAALALPPLPLLAGNAFLTCLLAGINFAHRNKGASPTKEAEISEPNPVAPRLWPIFALALLFTASVELLNSSLAAEVRRIFTLSATEVSPFVAKLLLGASLVVLVSQWAARRVLQRSWRAPLISGLLLLAAGAALFSVASNELQLWAAIALISVALGLVPPSYLTALAASSGTKRGRAAGTVAAMQTLGYAGGSALAALSLQVSSLGPAPALLAATGVCVLFGLYLCSAFKVRLS